MLLQFSEGDAFILAVTVKRDGVGVNLSVYDTVTLVIHDGQAAFGTNHISVTGTPDADQTTNPGLVWFTLTQANTNLPTGKTDMRGVWCVFCAKTDNTLRERTFSREAVILRNPYVAV